MTASEHLRTHIPSWLEKAIFYEIYPQSFQDTNGDGIGDIPGIIARLDYIQSLGVNAVWLNPCFASPFGDAGYDVSDYYTVAPRYGTNDDLHHLFEEAHVRGMRVVLDLVAGHTSIEHPWFKAASRHEKNEFSDWYIWTNTVWSGGAPGHTPIVGMAERNAGFIPNFFYFQPALNYGFAHPDPAYPWQQSTEAPGPRAVRQELRNIMKFWLDMGCDGFRVDMAASCVKNDPGSRMNIQLWQEMREWLEKSYPEAVLISEWGYPEHAIQAGFHMDFYLHIKMPGYTALFRKDSGCWQFSNRYGFSFFNRTGAGNILEFLEDYLHHYQATRKHGYICIPTGNHDIPPRLAVGRTREDLAVAYVFLMTMPGVPKIYYGDEIGMIGLQGLPSKEGSYERTEVRTPMQWEPGPAAGFSTAAADQLYLPVEPQPDGRTVADQEQDPNSTLNLVRKLVHLRKTHPALGNQAEFSPVYAQAGRYPLVYNRYAEGESIIVAVNPADRPAEVVFDADDGSAETAQALFGPQNGLARAGSRWRLSLPGVSAGIYQVRPKRQPNCAGNI